MCTEPPASPHRRTAARSSSRARPRSWPARARLHRPGEHRVKDFSEPVWIYQLGSERFPPLKTISNTNLPRPASSFVGREGELRELLVTIRSARLVTLTGPGGSGKTRLALEAAATLVPSYKAGVFWIGLASLRDPALVSETIAQTLGAKDGLAEHIGERELLLLLDNLEQVIEAAPQLSALLSACANLNVLVTSRELLRVQGEVEYAVPPLASPDAMALFCERSRLEPSEEIAQLCVRLDELPLAVELAAARATALSPSQILERLSQRLDLFKGGRDADPRQQTLRATIEWRTSSSTSRSGGSSRGSRSSRAAAPWTPPRRSSRRTSTRCSPSSTRACFVSRTSATGCWRPSGNMQRSGLRRRERPIGWNARSQTGIEISPRRTSRVGGADGRSAVRPPRGRDRQHSLRRSVGSRERSLACLYDRREYVVFLGRDRPHPRAGEASRHVLGRRCPG